MASPNAFSTPTRLYYIDEMNTAGTRALQVFLICAKTELGISTLSLLARKPFVMAKLQLN